MYVRAHSEVRKEMDVQSLVTSIILRQPKSYLPQEVHDEVNYYLSGSDFYDNHELIRRLVNQTINVLIRCNEVKCWGGMIYPTDIFGYTSKEYNDAVSKGQEGITNPNYWNPKKKLYHGEYY